MANRKRRRSKRNYSFNANRRRARRNPSLAGFTIPPLDAVLFTGAGLIVPPMVAKFIMPMLPTSMQTSKIAYYSVKAASVLVPSMLVKRFVSQRAGNLMLLGGAASFVIDLLKETGVFATLGLSGALSQPLLGYYPSLSAVGSGGLGKYPSLSANGMAPVTAARMISSVPERLNPMSRF